MEAYNCTAQELEEMQMTVGTIFFDEAVTPDPEPIIVSIDQLDIYTGDLN